MALKEFAGEEVGAGEDKRILSVLDRAGGSGRVAHRRGGFGPGRGTPGVPAPRLAGATAGGEVVAANRRGRGQDGLFEQIEEIEGTLAERCVELLDQAEAISRDLTNYRWWAEAS